MRSAQRDEPTPAPPPPFRLPSPAKLELQEGGGCLALFGAPFFLAGVFLLLNFTGLLPLDNQPKEWWARPVFGLMSLAFLGVGGWLLFGRTWITLDTTMGAAVRRRGLLVPMRTEERRLNDFTAVSLSFEAGDSDSADRYPIHLRSLHTDFLVWSPAEFAQARKAAEFLSHFLRLPLADTITDHEVLVGHQQAGESLQDRLRSTALTPAARPVVLRSEVTIGPGRASILIPGRNTLIAALFALVIPLVLLLVIAPALWRFFSQTRTPFGVAVAFLSFLIFGFGLLPLIGAVSLTVGSYRKRTVIDASPAGMDIDRRGAWKTKTTTIPASDILDIDYSTIDGAVAKSRRRTSMPTQDLPPPVEALKKWVPTKGVIVKTRRDLVAFGEGLPVVELAYLTATLKEALRDNTRSTL